MFENIKIALQSIKSNLLRTVLTIFIIAIGITSLVGILTAIDSIKHTINDNFIPSMVAKFVLPRTDETANFS